MGLKGGQDGISSSQNPICELQESHPKETPNDLIYKQKKWRLGIKKFPSPLRALKKPSI
jgi:hypothetical protein